MDLQEQAIKHYADKMLALAETLKIHPVTMFGACLAMIRGLYSVLPGEIKKDYLLNLHRFINELEHHDPVVTR
jgi:hypothetical protein